MSIDELSSILEISRNATHQHLASLGNLDLVEYNLRRSNGGRPVKNFYLSSKGLELFPRHYDLFSRLLVGWVRQRFDEQTLKLGLRELGAQLASDYSDRIDSLGSLPLKINEAATILSEMGYEANTSTADDGASEIIANNCVFHALANECNQVCELDLSLLGNLLNARIDHLECLVNGGLCCRFGITPV
jgi:DeoR family suf operon transcriptional repressor